MKPQPTVEYPQIIVIPEMKIDAIPDDADDDVRLKILYLRDLTAMQARNTIGEKPAMQPRKPKIPPQGYKGSVYLAQNIRRATGVEIQQCALREAARMVIPEQRIVAICLKKPGEFYLPEDYERVEAQIRNMIKPPAGWLSFREAQDDVEISSGAVNSFAESACKKDGGGAGRFINGRGKLEYYFSPQAVERLREEIKRTRSPKGWQLFRYFYVNNKVYAELAEMVEWARRFYKKNPDSVRIYRDNIGDPREHLSTPMTQHLGKTIAPRKTPHSLNPIPYPDTRSAD